VLAALAAVPFLDSTDQARDSEEAATVAAPRSGETTGAGAGASTGVNDLGDLGEITESALRNRYSADLADRDQAAQNYDAPAPAPAAAPPAPAASKARSSRSGQEAAAGSDTAGEAERAPAPSAVSADQPLSGDAPCVGVLRSGPAGRVPLLAVGSGTYQDKAVSVAVFDQPDGPVAYVAQRPGCAVLATFRL
ncbi:MAG: hypothetical protein ACRDY7_11475, partial [Acidimicrobiia bacterium]